MMKTPLRPLLVRVALRAAVTIAVTITGTAGVARAAESADEAAIRRGLELREKGNDDAALGEFQRAYDLKASGRARAQMALAEQALGRWTDAESHLSEALKTREPWISRNTAVLEQSLVEIREHVGSMELSGGQPGAEVRVNGRSIGKLPLDGPVRVEAGSVAVEVSAPGFLPIVRTVVVPAKGLARQPIVMVAITVTSGDAQPERALPHPIASGPEGGSGADVPPKPRRGGGWTGKKVAGMVVGIAGVGALAGGVAFHLLRETRAGKFNENCTFDMGMVTGAGNCQSQYDGIQQARNLAIAGYIAGPVLLGVSAFLLLTGSSDDDGQAAAKTRRFACAPMGLGAGCAARF